MTKEESEKYIKSKMCNNCGVYLGGGNCSDNCNVIEAIQALSQEPCEDCDYSEIVDWEQDAKTGKSKPIYWCERHKEPCEDAVSRQNIIEQYKSCADMLSDEELEGANLVMEWIYNSPPVRPQEPTNEIVQKAYEDGKKDGYVQAKAEQKTGYWVEKKGLRETYIECSECGGLAPSTEFADGVWFKKSNFCHEYGARMENEVKE